MTLEPKEEFDALVALTAALVSRTGSDQPGIAPELRRATTVNEAYALLRLIASRVAQDQSGKP